MSAKAKRRVLTTLAVAGVLAVIGGLAYQWLVGSVLRQLTDGRLEAADYWSDEPRILSGGMGFDNIIGLPEIDGPTVRDAGGSWYGSLTCANGQEPGSDLRTSAAIAGTIGQAFEGYADYDDGLPIVFSWPVATETVDPTDFRFTLNTGETVFPHAAGMTPNWEPTASNVSSSNSR